MEEKENLYRINQVTMRNSPVCFLRGSSGVARGNFSVQNIRVDAARKEMFISQTTYSHFANCRFFANYRFSFRFVPFRFAPFRFVWFRFAKYSKPIPCMLVFSCSSKAKINRLKELLELGEQDSPMNTRSHKQTSKTPTLQTKTLKIQMCHKHFKK